MKAQRSSTRLIRNLSLYTFLFLAVTLSAQKQSLTLEDIFSNGTYASEGFGPMKWYKGSTGFTTVEPAELGDGDEIVLYRLPSMRREVLIASSLLKPDGSSLSIRDYQWSEDGKRILIFTNTRRVWRYHTIGDFWVLDLKTGSLRKLGGNFPESSLQFAKFSPDGSKVAYVHDSNIFLEELNFKKGAPKEGANEPQHITALTKDGGGDLINGTFDWAYEEEFSCRDGFRWSPDGQKIAFWQINTEEVGVFHMINNIDSIYPEITSFAYPKVGTTNPEAKIGVIEVESGNILWMDIQGDARNNYLPRMDWAGNSEELVIQQINRRQNRNNIILASAANGIADVVFTEEVETWLDVYNDLTWVNKGAYFTWNSDRTGWQQLYLVSRDGLEIKPVTQGASEVISIASIDALNGVVYYINSAGNPLHRYLFKMKLDGTDEAEQVTPEGNPGHHAYDISPDNRFAIHRYSNSVTPPVVELIRLRDHEVVKVFTKNDALKSKFNGLDITPKSFFRLTLEEGTELDGWMIKPPDFDPTKRYPVIFYVYGEPAGTTVQDSWSGLDLFHYFLSQQGYLVISVDNRGTNVPRGREWRKSVYEQIGIMAAHDQAEVARQIQQWDFVDPDRIGIWGHSGGGSMTLNCMFRYPEIYKTGVSIAFVANQKLYDSFYQERYMGLPRENMEGYKNGSPITHAAGLEGNLLLIYGSGDDNCHYQNLEMLANELIRLNKYFTMIEYPMRSHSIRERENTPLHFRMSMYRYFLKNLPPGGK